jgi:hypothetical protein
VRAVKTKAGLLTIAIALVSAAPLLAADPGELGTQLAPVVKIHRGDKCVEPTDEMRRNHMEMILHQRDSTVHQGIRTSKHSLRECINCHADPGTRSVLGPEGFCQSCHTYAAVSMDCFSCHNHKAEKDAKVPPLRSSVRSPEFLDRLATTAPANTR